jgi:hypothetical protein
MQAFRENAQRNDEARGFDGASPNMVAKVEFTKLIVRSSGRLYRCTEKDV